MKSRVGVLIKLILLVPVTALLLSLFLTVCYCVPLDQVNYQMSVDELENEGWYTDVLELRPGYDQNFFSDQPGIQPVCNDRGDYVRAAGLSDKGPLYNAMAMVNEYGEHYARYWHGYAGILRLLLVPFDCKEIKFLSFIFQILLVLLVAFKIREKGSTTLSFLFLTQYVLLMPLAVSQSMVFAFSIDLSFIAILVYMTWGNRFEKGTWFLSLFCMLGMLTCFFEELVFGVLTWGIAITWILLFSSKECTSKDYIKDTICSGISWIWGYGGIWFMKWILATLVMGENIIADGLGSVIMRSSSAADAENSKTGLQSILERLSAISENYKYYYYTVYFLILALWVIYLTYRLIRYKIRIDSVIPALGMVALAPIVWYLALSNHTLGHRFMTYRIMNCGIIAVLAILFLSTYRGDRKKERQASANVAFKSLLITVPMIMALIAVTNKTEGFESKNVELPGGKTRFSECAGGLLSMELTPNAKEISNLGIVLHPEGSTGFYEFRLLRDGEVIHSVEQPMSIFSESSWQMPELNWKVNPGTKYVFEIVPVCATGDGGTVAVCYPEQLTVSDLGYITGYEGGTKAQITYWMIYQKSVSGRKWIFYFLTWFAVFECIIIVIRNIAAKKPEDGYEADHSDSLLQRG